MRLLVDVPDIDVNQANNEGMTPLLVASWRGHAGVTKQLLTHSKTEVNKISESGSTALYMASAAGNVDVVSQLLGHRFLGQTQVDVNYCREKGKTIFFEKC